MRPPPASVPTARVHLRQAADAEPSAGGGSRRDPLKAGERLLATERGLRTSVSSSSRVLALCLSMRRIFSRTMLIRIPRKKVPMAVSVAQKIQAMPLATQGVVVRVVFVEMKKAAAGGSCHRWTALARRCGT